MLVRGILPDALGGESNRREYDAVGCQVFPAREAEPAVVRWHVRNFALLATGDRGTENGRRARCPPWTGRNRSRGWRPALSSTVRMGARRARAQRARPPGNTRCARPATPDTPS